MMFIIMTASVLFGAWSEAKYHWFQTLEGHFFVHVLRFTKLKK